MLLHSNLKLYTDVENTVFSGVVISLGKIVYKRATANRHSLPGENLHAAISFLYLEYVSISMLTNVWLLLGFLLR